ncbi:MAG: hypothetical protein V2A58_08935 [Planctomycetota bacterium]
MEDLFGFLIVVLFFAISIISAVVKALREQRARRSRPDARPQGTYAAPADEVRKFLESVRSRDAAPSRTGSEPPRQVPVFVKPAAPAAGRGEPKRRAQGLANIDRAILERQERLSELAAAAPKHAEVATAEKSTEAPRTAAQAPVIGEVSQVARGFGDPAVLRRAVIWSEILGQPRALRPHQGRGQTF